MRKGLALPGWVANFKRRMEAAAVLIVEDDADTARAVTDALVDLGYRTVCARDGGEALAALERERPAVMLVDIFMPGMNGSELLARVRASLEWSQIPRVIMTGANDPMIGVKEDAAVLYKPVDIDALRNIVERYCRPSG